MFLNTSLLLGLVTLVASGCAPERLLSVKEQMCNHEDYVQVKFGRTLSIRLHEPVLLERDVYLLLGVLPTSRIENRDGVLTSFVFEQLQGASNEIQVPTEKDIRLDLKFEYLDEQMRLAQIEMGEIPVELLGGGLMSEEAMEAIFTQVCNFSINPFVRTMSIDIDHTLIQDLPGRQAVVNWLGEPIELLDSGNTIAYEYRLKGQDTNNVLGRVMASFDDSGDNPLRVEASFSHYLANIDLKEAKLKLKFTL